MNIGKNQRVRKNRINSSNLNLKVLKDQRKLTSWDFLEEIKIKNSEKRQAQHKKGLLDDAKAHNSLNPSKLDLSTKSKNYTLRKNTF